MNGYAASKYASSGAVRDNQPNNYSNSSQAQFENVNSRKYMPPPSEMFTNNEEPRERRISGSSIFSVRADAGHTGLLGPKRPKVHKIWKKKWIKVMVVGDSGLGKTTLIKALLSTPGERLTVHDGSFTPSEQFTRDPDSLCSTITWRDEEDRCVWIYKVQDTPGYGDDLDVNKSIAAILAYIEAQNQKWLHMEQSRERKEDLAEVEDPRVDLVLFCLPPHRLRAVDVKVMYEVGCHVPIVPVVTKADTLTIREAGMYRQELANKLSNPMLPGIKEKINVLHFERDTLERAGLADKGTPYPPFLVVASNDINDEMNGQDPPVYWPERRYPWGTAEAFNREHSDLLSLRALLLKEALEEINKTKRQRYEAWRRRALGGLRLGKKLRNTLLFTVLPAVIALQIGRRGIKIDDIKRHSGTVRSWVGDRIKQVKGSRKPAPPPPAPVAPAPAPAPPPPPPPPQKKGWF